RVPEGHGHRPAGTAGRLHPVVRRARPRDLLPRVLAGLLPYARVRSGRDELHESLRRQEGQQPVDDVRHLQRRRPTAHGRDLAALPADEGRGPGADGPLHAARHMTGRSRVLAYALALGLIELTTRAVVYALSEPTGLSVRLGGRLGGPRTAVVALVAVGLAALLATAIVALAAMGARERWALADPGARGARPRVRLRAAAARAAALWLGGMLVFTVVENYVHHRA